MRVRTISLSAAGPSQWVAIDSEQNSFGVGLLATVQGGSTLTYKVQAGFWSSDQDRQHTDNITRSTTTATIVFGSAHGLQVGDSMAIQGCGGAPLDGTYDVASVVDQFTVTYTVVNSGITACQPGGARVHKIHVTDHSTMTALNSSTQGNFAFPISFVRLYATAYTGGQVNLSVAQGLGR